MQTTAVTSWLDGKHVVFGKVVRPRPPPCFALPGRRDVLAAAAGGRDGRCAGGGGRRVGQWHDPIPRGGRGLRRSQEQGHLRRSLGLHGFRVWV